MKIRRGARRKLRKWRDKMKAANKHAVIDNLYRMCAYVDKDGNDPICVAAELWEKPRQYRLGQISDEGLYEVFLAFSDFHKRGKEFRMKWNATLAKSEAYAQYIEEGRKKHMFDPFRTFPKFLGPYERPKRDADGNWE